MEVFEFVVFVAYGIASVIGGGIMLLLIFVLVCSELFDDSDNYYHRYF